MVFPSFLVDNNNNKQFYLNLPVDVQRKFKIVSKESITIHTPFSSCSVQLHEDKAGLLYLDPGIICNLFEKFTLKEKCFLHCFSTKPGELFVRPIHDNGVELRYVSQCMHYQHPNHLQSLHPVKRLQLYLPTTFGYASLASGVKPSILKTSKGRFSVTTQYLGDRGLNFIGISWEQFYDCHFLDLDAYALFQYEGDGEFQASFFSANGCQIPFNILYPLGSEDVEASTGAATSSGYAIAKNAIIEAQHTNKVIAGQKTGYPTINIDDKKQKCESNANKGKDTVVSANTSQTDAASFTIRLTKEKINNNRLVLPTEATCITPLWDKKKVLLNCRGYFYDMELHHYTEFKRGNVETPMMQLLGRWDVICNQRPTWLRKTVQFKVQRNQPKDSDAVSMIAFIVN